MLPKLRLIHLNRFLAGLKPDLNNESRRKQWVRWMQKLDLAARRKEIQNIPADYLKNLIHRLDEPADRNILIYRAILYSDKLLVHDQRQPNFYQTLQAAVTAPSEYSTAMRVVGIYPLTSIPVTSVTRRVQDKFKKWHNDMVSVNPSKPTVYYYFSHGHCRYRQYAPARSPCCCIYRPRPFR